MRRDGGHIAWWRLWSLQGSWNRQSLQTLGWWCAWAPWLRERVSQPADRGEWLRAQDPASNTNPWAAGLILGARMRLEADGLAEQASRFEIGLSRALGGLGDAFMWLALRPTLVLLAVAGSAWWGWAAVVTVWVLFAVLQAWARSRFVKEGYRLGQGLAEFVAHPAIHALTAHMRHGGGALAGFVVVLLIGHQPQGGQGAAPVAMLASLTMGSLLLLRRFSPEVLSASALVVWMLIRLLERLGGA